MSIAAISGPVIAYLAGVLSPLIGAAATQHFKRKTLLKHIASDLSNTERHFHWVEDEVRLMDLEPNWKRLARLKWQTFASRGFISHSRSNYFLLNRDEADHLSKFFVYLDNFDRLCETVIDHVNKNGKLPEGAQQEIVRRAKSIQEAARQHLIVADQRAKHLHFGKTPHFTSAREIG